MKFSKAFRLHRFLRFVVLIGVGRLSAQVPTQPAEPTPPPGQVVSAAPTELAIPAEQRPAVPITQAERAAIEVTALILDLHMTPATAREEVHATITVRNRSDAVSARIPLQLSSTLHWLTASAATASGLKPIPFTQSPIATDADHTGYGEEAIFAPAEPLAPGASLTLSVVYGGEIKPSADRLELIGAPHDRAAETDWDAIAPTSDTSATALRGFGNVLWYPCAAPVALFGDGNRLFDLIGRERQRNTGVSVRLRLTVEYVGDPPDAAIFDGRLQPLVKAPDESDQLVDATRGTATAEFAAAPIGFRTPSLFLTAQRAQATPDQLLTAVSPQAGAADPYAAAVANLQPVLTALLGPVPRAPLLLLDHAGEPFEDSGFIVAQLSAAADPKLLAPALVRGLTHAWMSPQARPVPATGLWIDEGIPELMSLVWTERTQGREAAIGTLRQSSAVIALAESMGSQPLTTAYADVFLRLKSAAVFWQLRELLGDELFSRSLTAYRKSLGLNPALDRDEKALEKSIEKTSGRDLGWFFDDWVYRDKGLPDLTIVQANPRPLQGRAGSLVAVEVRNDGDAVADVPVTVRAGTLSATERLQIPGHGSASTRVVFGGTPETVEVNDGSVPELRTTTHSIQFANATGTP